MDCTEQGKLAVIQKSLSFFNCDQKHEDNRYAWGWKVWAFVGFFLLVIFVASAFFMRKKK
jgi:hypothetical protein